MVVDDALEEKVNLVTKEIELTKLLASNDPKTRSKGIKQIKQLLLQNSGDKTQSFQLNDYLIIWRGLFYFMWMSDKPLPQESATEKISNLINCCTSYQGKILFVEAFFLTIKDDWLSISQHRIDKFMMLVRRCLRQLLFTFVNCDWNLEYMQKFNEVLYTALKTFTLSLRSHLQEIFLEELAKVSQGKVPSEALIIILDAFLHFISELNDAVLIKEVVQNVFRNLLSQSSDMEILEAKFLAWKKMGRPGNSYNDLELVEGDIADDDSNEQNNGPLDPRAGNVSIEIPRIKFNPKDVSNILKKYVNEVDCSKKCLIEITKLIKWYNRLGDGVLPYKPKDLKLNSQVLKRKKKKYLSKMVKEGVKRLEMVDSKIKKGSRQVSDYKSLKELEKMGEVIVEHGKIGKSVWKVRKFDDYSLLKENSALNGSWTVSEESNANDTPKEIVSVAAEDTPPLLVPIGFSVEVSPEKMSIENTTPSLKSLMSNPSSMKSSSTKRKSPKSKITDGSISKINTVKSNCPVGKKNELLNDSNLSLVNNCSPIDKEYAPVKKQSPSFTKTPDSVTKSIKKNKKLNTPQEQNTAPIINQNPSFAESSNINIKDVSESQSPLGDLVMSKIQLRSNENNTSLNESWSVCSDEKLNSSKQKSPKSKINNESITKNNTIPKPNSPAVENSSPNVSVSTSPDSNCSVPAKKKDSASKPKKAESGNDDKRSSLSSTVTPEKNSKSPKSPKSPTPEQRVLRRRTIIISKKKPIEQNPGTPKKRVKNTTTTATMQKRRKTIAGEEIAMSMLKPDEISNKALEKIRSETFEDCLGTPRKSSRLSVKSDSAKKRVQIQLAKNIEQEFLEYTTTLKKKKTNPHDASKQPVHGVLKSTPDTNRINPFYKFKETSAKRNSRKSII